MWRIEFINLLIILLSCANSLLSYDLFPQCEYITEPSALKVFFGDAQVSHNSTCFKDLFEGGAKQNNRSKIHLIKITNNKSDYDDDIYPLDGFFPNLRELDASSSPLYPNLKFRYLKKFNGSTGKLISLSASIFEHLPSLEEIDFSGNYISRIEKGTFDANPKLSTINISHNALTYLDANTFSKLSELEILDLSFNQIEIIENGAFQHNVKLELLALGSNPLRRFDCNLFTPLASLKSLGFNLDNIEEFDLSCAGHKIYLSTNHNNEYAIRYSNTSNELRLSIPVLSNFTYFNIAGKQLHNTDDIIRQLGSQLQSLDLSGNQLSGLPLQKLTELRSLNVSNTGLTNIESSVLSALRKLKYLDISDNDLTKVNFESLAPALKKLEGFYIRNITVDVLEILPLLSSTLEALDLSNNQVKSINSETLESFPNLRHLSLSNCGLEEFKFGTFYHQTELETLDIAHNSLGKIDFTLFALNFKQLRVLNLEENDLSTLKTITPLRFPKLKRLGISLNDISCDYLVSFLLNWPRIELMHNPRDLMNIDGVSCNRKKWLGIL